MVNGSQKNFQAKILKTLVFMIPLLLCVPQTTVSMESEQKRTAHLNWTSISAGYAHANDPYGYSLALSHSRLFGIHEATLRIVHFNEVPHPFGGSGKGYAFDIGLLYGPCWTPTISYREHEGITKRWLSMSFSLSSGIAAVFGSTGNTIVPAPDDNGMIIQTSDDPKEVFHTIGLPVKAEIRFVPASRFSFGISGQANFNKQESFFSAMLGAQYGLMRSDKELQRTKARSQIWHNLPASKRKNKILTRTIIGVATLTCGTISLASHLRAAGAEGAADDYLEMRNGSYSREDYQRYDAMYNEERKLIQSRRILRNVFGGCFLAGTAMFAVVFEI